MSSLLSQMHFKVDNKESFIPPAFSISCRSCVWRWFGRLAIFVRCGLCRGLRGEVSNISLSSSLLLLELLADGLGAGACRVEEAENRDLVDRRIIVSFSFFPIAAFAPAPLPRDLNPHCGKNSMTKFDRWPSMTDDHKKSKAKTFNHILHVITLDQHGFGDTVSL
jgi:hypothetical protein